MGRLGMGVYDKVFLRFPERFWGDDWVVRQQGPAGVDWHSWYDMSRVTGEPVLAALVGGAGARRIESLPDPLVVDEAVTALRRMFGPSVPQPDAVRITRWAADPFARGSYSYLHVGASPDDHDLLGSRCGRVQLAGEATWGDDPATVHGALLSGLRAAGRVARARGRTACPSPNRSLPERSSSCDIRTTFRVSAGSTKSGGRGTCDPIVDRVTLGSEFRLGTQFVPRSPLGEQIEAHRCWRSGGLHLCPGHDPAVARPESSLLMFHVPPPRHGALD